MEFRRLTFSGLLRYTRSVLGKGAPTMRTTIFATMALAMVGCSAGTHIDDTPNQQNPANVNYVLGPYGYTQGSVIQNIQFVGKVDPQGAAGMANYGALTMSPITLASYHNDPSV